MSIERYKASNDYAKRGRTGLAWASLVVGSWLLVHLYSVFFHSLSAPLWQTIVLIIFQCWLYVGMFIIAHDTMHGSLVPGHPGVNALIGRVIMIVYAGFSWRFMKDAHMKHHQYPGTDRDPDFNTANPRDFWPWYFKFFTQYFGLRQLLILAGFTVVYIAIMGANYSNTVIMWALPAILSSVQLFYFGTYLTHRHGEEFDDHHNARSNTYPGWLSLLTCFHFGYHHEHHLFPHEPWWRLPAKKEGNVE